MVSRAVLVVRATSFVLLLAIMSSAAGDILHMRDGSRHYGTLVSESRDEIVFRVTLPDGKSASVRRFPRNIVDRLEISPISRPPTEDSTDETVDGDAATDRRGTAGDELQESLQRLAHDDKREALRLLQRAVSRAKPDELAELERVTRVQRCVELAELMAALRYETSLSPGKTRVLKLTHVTRYESEALGDLLERKLAPLLAQEFAGRALGQWTDGATSYDELRSDAKPMVDTARLAAGIISARLRYDPRLKKDRESRVALVAQQERLTEFAARVSTMPGFTSLGTFDDPTDPGLVTARAIAATRPAATQPASQPATSRPAEEHP